MLDVNVVRMGWFRAASWMRAERPSAQRRKRLGERGSPCRIPQVNRGKGKWLGMTRGAGITGIPQTPYIASP
nr:hypothetical protein CFP56_51751 [Quercus suber]